MNTAKITGWSNETTRLVWKHLTPESIEDFEFKRACFEEKINDIECPLSRSLIQASKIHWEEILETIIL
jgi:hypothetical protein